MLKQIEPAQIFSKILLTLLVAVLAFPCRSEAIVLSVLKQSNMEVILTRTVGKLTYNDTEPAWRLKTSANFKITGNPSVALVITTPATVALTVSGKTGTATIITRCKTGSYPTSKTDGVSCTGAINGADNYLWVASFPVSVVIDQDSSGAYVGSEVLTVTY